MSLPGRRLLATLAVFAWVGFASLSVSVAAELPASTWVRLTPLPGQGATALFALAVDPANNQAVIAANSQGVLAKSVNGGSSWRTVLAGNSPVNFVSFNPSAPGMVLAGTRRGLVVSRDGGATWSNAGGLDGRNVRVVAFALTMMAAGTDRGVYTSGNGLAWTPSGLADRSISAIAVQAIHDPVRLIAGTDAPATGGALPLFQSLDGGATWKQTNPALSGTMTIKLAAGPLPPTGNIRPLLVGTNTGLFASNDNGASFTPLSGGGLLPTIDYTQAAFITTHHDRFYVASDGGGSKSGGLWRTNDAGQTFASLQPPQPSVTALAVSNDELPTLYVAAFQPSTHAASLWTYHDTGGTPVGPPSTPPASAPRIFRGPDTSTIAQILSSPQLPYIGLGLGAMVIILTAIAAHLRGRYR